MSSAVGDDERWEERDETRRQREGAWPCYGRGVGGGGWGFSSQLKLGGSETWSRRT